MLAQRRTHPAAIVAFVSQQPLRAQLWTTAPVALDDSVLHQTLEYRRFMRLARCQNQGDQRAGAICAEVDFRADATLAASKRFRCRVPFFAPAAC